MRTVRKKVFETNSSCCHCLTTISKENYDKLKDDNLIIHIPASGEYQISDKFEIITLDEALNLWNSNVDEYNERYKAIDFHVDSYPDTASFKKAMEEDVLSYDDLFGRFLTRKMLKKFIKKNGQDYDLDLFWWNYD